MGVEEGSLMIGIWWRSTLVERGFSGGGGEKCEYR